jgi:nitronate monooxygenase
MWPDRRLVDLLKIEFPVVQTPVARTMDWEIAAARDEGTAVTNLMTGRPARGITNRLKREIGPMSDVAPEFPLAAGAVAPLRAKAAAPGSGDFSPMWAGQGTSLLGRFQPGELTRKLAAETMARMGAMAAAPV